MKMRSGDTNHYDAMWSSLNMLRQAHGQRKAIVVMTDGVDNNIDEGSQRGSHHTFAEMLERIQEEDVTVYPIYLDTEAEMVSHNSSSGHEDYAMARKQLAAVAEESGGLLFKAARAEDLEGVYPRVASEL